jgi:hypothetical protein
MPISSTLEATRLLRLQVGQETTWGTNVPATAILHGTAPVPQITPMVKVTQFDEQLGALTPSFRSAQTATGGLWSHSGNVLYEDILYTLAQAFGLPTPALVSPKTITTITKAAAAVVTATAHGFATGQSVLITGSNSSPVIDGVQVVTRLTADTFSVPVNTASGTAGTAGSASGTVSWTFLPPVGATFTPVSYTMELGNVSLTDDVEAAGCLLDTWTIKGENQKQLTYDAKGFFKTFATGTLATGISLRTVETVLTPSVALALDVALGTPGTTPFAASLVTFELSGTTGLKPVHAGGALGPVSYTFQKQDAGLKLGLLYNSTLATYLGANPNAGLPLVVQLKATSGVKSLEMDFSGVLKSDPVYWGDSQGAQIIELDLGAQYDTALANYMKVVVTNQMVNLP